MMSLMARVQAGRQRRWGEKRGAEAAEQRNREAESGSEGRYAGIICREKGGKGVLRAEEESRGAQSGRSPLASCVP